MNDKVYSFRAVIAPVRGEHGAFIRFPCDVRAEFGRGRVNMGVKNPDGSICYITGVRRDTQKKTGKGPAAAVTIRERQ